MFTQAESAIKARHQNMGSLNPMARKTHITANV
jgi:hypothetical protein